MRFLRSSTLPIVLVVLAAAVFAWLLAQRYAGANHPVVEVPRAAVDLPPGPAGGMRTLVVGGGCFWCVEAFFSELKGVSAAVSGYAGGTAETANYDDVRGSAHAEAVRITYDPAVISFGELLRVLFTVGDPTSVGGQYPDYGPQYRMAVFYQDADERRVAEAYLRQIEAAKVFARPLAVTVEPMPHGFFTAEEYHQRFVARNPDHPYVCQWMPKKMARLRAAFADQLKAPAPR
jgi:peptide-methionine (S)-S-oxide reductase